MWLCGCVARAASLRLCLRGCRARHYALRAAPTDQRTMTTYLNRKTLSVVAEPRTETGVRAMTPRPPLLRIHRQPRAPPSSRRGHCAIRLHAWSPPFRWFSHGSLMVLSWFSHGSLMVPRAHRTTIHLPSFHDGSSSPPNNQQLHVPSFDDCSSRQPRTATAHTYARTHAHASRAARPLLRRLASSAAERSLLSPPLGGGSAVLVDFGLRGGRALGRRRPRRLAALAPDHALAGHVVADHGAGRAVDDGLRRAQQLHVSCDAMHTFDVMHCNVT